MSRTGRHAPTRQRKTRLFIHRSLFGIRRIVCLCRPSKGLPVRFPRLDRTSRGWLGPSPRRPPSARWYQSLSRLEAARGLITGTLHVLSEFCHDRDCHDDRGWSFVPSDPVDDPVAHARAGPAASVRGYLDRRETNSCCLCISGRRNRGLRSGPARLRPMAEKGRLRPSISIGAILIF